MCLLCVAQPVVQNGKKHVKVRHPQMVGRTVPVPRIMTQEVLVPVARPYVEKIAIPVPQITTQMMEKTVDKVIEVALKRQESTVPTEEKMVELSGSQRLHREVDVMVSQSSRTEVVKKIRETGQVTKMIEGPQVLVQTVRDEPETWSPEAEGVEKDRIVESDVGCADGFGREPVKGSQARANRVGGLRKARADRAKRTRQARRSATRRCRRSRCLSRGRTDRRLCWI